jgi:HEAT repeat protein/protein-S-isoprenylcysteine O-methyltransferase Ste14
MKKIKLPYGIILTVLALVFTLGLTFASVELPRLVDTFLHENIDFLDVATGQDELTAYKTELFLSHNHIRLIGYICLGIIITLIVTGFVLEKRKLASLGAIFLFLPVFGHFAATMFFLGGLAFLRFLWLPFLDISFDIMRLGDIVLLPYKWILDLTSLTGLNLWEELPFIITGLGLFIFLLGVLAWMYGRMQKKPVTDFWIYRLSRHPQYLGWIIWSYGVLFLPGANMKRYVDVANTLPWLLATMVIIAVAMLEERKMQKTHGASYESFRQRTPFLFPLPRFIRKIFSLPLRITFKKEYPERKREIFTIIGFYTVLCLLLSAFSSGLIGLSGNKVVASETNIAKLVHTIETAKSRADMRNAAAKLAEIDGAAVDSLITLLGHENVFIRWYCADALGSVKSEKIVKPLLKLLDDPDQTVRRMAAGSLGKSGSSEAVQPLINALLDSAKGIQSYAARALGVLGAQDAVQPLIKVLQGEDQTTSRWAAWALGEIGAKETIEPLIYCLEERVDCDYYQVGMALRKLDSNRSVDAFIAGVVKGVGWAQSACATALGESRSEKAIDPLINALKEGSEQVRRAAVFALQNFKVEKVINALRAATNDSDMEVRMYAREALKKMDFQDNRN